MHRIRWTADKLARRLALIEPLVYKQRAPIAPFRYRRLSSPLDNPPVGVDVNDETWDTIAPQAYWGEWRTDFVLRTHFQVPREWRAAPIALYLPFGDANDFGHPESLAYIDGMPFTSCDRFHQEILLDPKWCDGESHVLALHGWTGRGTATDDERGTQLFMRPCFVVTIDQATRDFSATARVALGTVNALDADEPVRGRLLNALDAAFKVLDTREPWDDKFYASVPVAHQILREGLAASGRPLNVSLVGAGHAHIDVAWLWTLGQTRRKAGRTFHNVIHLMERFPEFYFTQSQPQLYDFTRQDDPELFDAIKRRVAEGRWETLGGMWVEADCNLTGAESLARQFLLGRNFFRQHFGAHAESPVLWLPDVFGYAWNLPQLIKQAGLDYFFTIKLSWNQYNRIPYDSFWWQGLDGTRVLTHFSTTPPVDKLYGSTYNAEATPGQVMGTWKNFQQKESQQELLMAYGYGDGGGGPTREMLENLREMKAFPGLVQTRTGTVKEFFRALEKNSGDNLPVWNGELYFELHRGTYTTQSRNKRANRQSEFLLHDAEFVATLATTLDPGFAYPRAELNHAWELVCLNQFHDVIPGSSVGEVYAESQKQYGEIRALGEQARDNALQAIAQRVGGDVLIVNPTSFARRDFALWRGGEGALALPDGTPVPIQVVREGVLIDAGELPPYSVTALNVSEHDDAVTIASPVAATPRLLENNFLRVELNDAGDITRIFDKTNQREVLPPNTIANQFQAFEDRPLKWEAWDVDIFYDDKMWLSDPATSVQVVENGPLRATIEIRRRILNSAYTQRIALANNSAHLDFDTTMDWRERHILLKVAFPVDVLSPTATYEIQWGNVERPTHRNTSWDWARFETCAHKWVDLSEGGYGASLLNDCKYGHDIRDNVMRLSLLRGTITPDPNADQGEHRFAYSLLPHAGRWNETTIAAAYALNDPLIAFASPTHNPGLSQPHSFVVVDRANVVIETIKRAEDDDGIIVRMYETQRQRGTVTLTTSFNLAQAWHVNLIEDEQTELPVNQNQVSVFIKPFEIVTLRLKPAA